MALAALVIVGIHGALLLSTLGNWRVTIDSAYHVSLARAFGEHGLILWDHINFGPAGRPNLQAPLMYVVLGAMGRAMGGTGADYVAANAILAMLQWLAAIATAACFAFWLGGEWAMLLATALLSGAGFAASSFAAGIPSGWLFILIPWAIYFFLRRRLVLATAAVSAAIYVHIAGIVTAPFGILIAAALRRRWRDLVLVGIATAIVTAPYYLHVVQYLGWFSGVRSYSALLFDPLLDALGLAGFIAVLWRPRERALLAAWAIAPLAWIFQDPGRFILQSGLVASVLAGVWLAAATDRLGERRRAVWAAALAAIATLCPLGVPALAGEAAWASGIHYPRALDWNTAGALAEIIQRHGLGMRLVADYQPALCPAIAVYTPIACDKGHWVEVQPPVDPADKLSAASKVYILPLSADDPVLAAMARRQWVRVWGGVADASVVTLSMRAPLDEATAAVGEVVAREAGWLSTHAVNNSLNHGALRAIFTASARRARRARMTAQRERAGRIQLALIVYAGALESGFPGPAARARRAARAFGVIASFLGDDLALDFESNAATARLRWRLGLLAAAARALGRQPPPDEEFERAQDETIASYLVTRGDTFAERPPHDELPWLAAISWAH